MVERARGRWSNISGRSWLLAPTATLFALAATTTACGGGDCKEFAAPGLIVRIVDEDATPVCDAGVTARDQGFTEILMPFAGGVGHPCQYLGAYERTGTYTIDAIAGGRFAGAGNIEVDADSCHVHPVTIELTMRR